jgi:hypothetical protein
MIACTPKGYYRIEMNKKLTDNLADLKIMRIFAPSYYKTLNSRRYGNND